MLMICRDNKLHYQLFIGVSEIKANTNRKMDGCLQESPQVFTQRILLELWVIKSSIIAQHITFLNLKCA